MVEVFRHFAQVTLAVLADKCVQAALKSALQHHAVVSLLDAKNQENVWDPELWLKPDSHFLCRGTDVGRHGVSLSGFPRFSWRAQQLSTRTQEVWQGFPLTECW